MAYQARPDGLNDLILDDGTRVVSPLPADQLQAMGHSPIEAQQPPSMAMGPDALAQNRLPMGATLTMMDAPNAGPPKPFEQQVSQQLQQAAGPASPDLRLPTRDEQVNDQRRATARVEEARQKADTSKLIPMVPGASGAPAGGAGYAPQRVTKIKGGDVRASFTRIPGQEVPDDVKRDALNTDAEDLELTADAIATQREELRQKRELQLIDQQKTIDREAARRTQVDQRLSGLQSVIDHRDREIEKMRPQSAQDVIDDRGWMGRVGAALTMAVSGYGASLMGSTENPGYRMLRDSIMDEVASQ